MKHLKKFEEVQMDLSDSERKKILVARGKCPVCESSLKEEEYGEDEDVYLECSQDSDHYSEYLGMAGDLGDYDDEVDNEWDDEY